MTKEEYQNESMVILDRIADYDADNFECEARIANNNREIILLNNKRAHLLREYQESQKKE